MSLAKIEGGDYGLQSDVQQQTAGGANSNGAVLSGASETSGSDVESAENNPGHDASECVKIYGPDNLKARGMTQGVLPTKMFNIWSYAITVQWCVEPGDGRIGNCNPRFSSMWYLAGVGQSRSNSYGIDALNQKVNYAACRKSENMGFVNIITDPRSPFLYACK